MKLQEIIKQHTSEDGTTNWSAVESAVNDDINAIVVKSVAKEKEKAQSEYLKALGFESEADLKKKLSDDGKAEVLKQLDEVKKAHDELQGKYEPLATKATTLERATQLFKLGITDEDTVDYIVHAVSKRTDENTTFEDALKTYQDEKPNFFQVGAPRTTATPSGGGANETAGFEKYLAERHPELFSDD
jgi:hypothetical protein